MKTKLILLAACAAITNAYSTSITWDDSSDHVNIIASGTGFGTQTFDSPDGNWQFTLQNYGDFRNSLFDVNVHGVLTFLGELPADIYYPLIDDRDHGYHDLSKLGQFHVAGTGMSGFFTDDRQEGWSGKIAMLVTDTPILDDPSTWSWMTSFRVAGRSVPEGGSAWLMMAFASGVLLCFRPKSA